MRYKSYQEVLEGLKPLNRVAYLRYMRAINNKDVPKWPFPQEGHPRLSSALICSFPTIETTEGVRYWNELYQALYALEDETIRMVAGERP